MRKIAALFLLLAAPAQAGPVDDAIRTEIAKRHIPGLSVAVLRAGKPVLLKGYGVANLKSARCDHAADGVQDRVPQQGLHRRRYVAAGARRQAGAGRPGVQISERRAPGWRGITIRQLLTHTSGIVRDPSDYHPYDVQTLMDVIHNAYALPLATPPG